jgi:hypothetical protein
MNADSIIKRLRGAVGNAVVWGAGWAALGFTTFAALKLAGILPASAPWLDAIVLAGKFGIIGGVTGAAFSLVIGLLYRGRRLSEISAVRFGAGGGIMAALFVPAFFQAMNLLSGDGMVPMGQVLDDSVWAVVFGGVAAGVSLKLAQRVDRMLSAAGPDQPGLLGSGNPLASAAGWDAGRRSAYAGRGAGN